MFKPAKMAKVDLTGSPGPRYQNNADHRQSQDNATDECSKNQSGRA